MRTIEPACHTKHFLGLAAWTYCWRLILLLLFLCLTTASHAALLGHWTFEEGGGTFTADISGSNNDGTLVGGPLLPAWIEPGAVGSGALEFFSTGGRVSLPNSAEFQITGPLTVTAWTWADATGGGRVISKGGNSGSRGWELTVESAGYYQFLVPAGPSALVSCRTDNDTVPLGVWTHLAAVYDPSGPSMELYTNGVLAASVTDGVPAVMYNPASISPSIGARPDGNNRWSGKLDEIRIYSEALNSAEIQVLPELIQNPLAFTVQPVSITVAENQPATFSCGFTGSPSLFIQWYSNGVPVPGANGLTHTIPAVTMTMNHDQYSVAVSNFVYGITSTNATLEVSGDVTPPTVVSVEAAGNPNRVIVTFSEAVTAESAEVTLNYVITNMVGNVLAVNAATLGSDNRTVTLSTDTLTDGSSYALVVNNIQDRAIVPQTIAADTTAFFTCHTLLGYWPFDDGSGDSATDLSVFGNTGTLAGSPLPIWVTPGAVGSAALDFTPAARVNLPGSPSLQITGPLTLTAWTLANAVNGARIISKGTGTRGWELTLENDGSYQFLIPISSSVLVTCVSLPGAAPLGVWTHLAAVYNPTDPEFGNIPSMKLYINGGLVATTIADVPTEMYNNTSIVPTIGTRPDGSSRWTGKLDEVRVYGEALSDVQIQALPELVQTPLAFTSEPASITVSANSAATFSTTFVGSPPYYIQWYSNDTAIPDAIYETYTIPVVVGSMHGDQYRVTVNNLIHGISSSNATLSVSTDIIKPTVVSVVALGSSDQVVIKFSEPVSVSTAENVANYAITNTSGDIFNVNGATLGQDNLTVTLLTDTLNEAENYVLVVNNIQDLALIPNTISPDTTLLFAHSSLVGHWEFEEGVGNTAADSGLGGFDGTLLNAPTWVAGQVGQFALEFDGINDRVDVGNPSALQLTGPMTVAAWVWANNLNDNGRIVTKGGGSGNRGWSLNGEKDGRWSFQVAISPSSLEALYVDDVPLNEWVHVVGVYDPYNINFGPVLMLYTNGTLAGIMASSVMAQYNSGLNVSIGARPDDLTRWNGKIDDVRIYARALGDAEIATLAVPPAKFLPPVVINNELILRWTGEGQLQSAPEATGIFTNIIPTPTSPFTNAIVPGGRQFFRLEP